MASNMTSAKKFIVRTSLVTGSTLAVIVGAQTLIGVDLQKSAATPQPQIDQIAQSPTTTTQLPAAAIPNQTIVNAAPNVVILRRPSQSGITAQSSNSGAVVQRQTIAPVSIQPPSPVAIPQQQTIVQSPGSSSGFVPTTRSTR